jgi:anti-sigma factor RsiW
LILRLVSGELAPSEARELREHLDACPACQAVWAELQETWRLLGAWEVSAPERNLAPAVLQAADAGGPQAGFAGGQALRWPTVLRAAASIGLAAGLGIGTGYLVPMGSGGKPQTTNLTVEADEVLGSLGLAELGTSSATGLSLELDTEEALPEEEASS